MGTEGDGMRRLAKNLEALRAEPDGVAVAVTPSLTDVEHSGAMVADGPARIDANLSDGHGAQALDHLADRRDDALAVHLSDADVFRFPDNIPTVIADGDVWAVTEKDTFAHPRVPIVYEAEVLLDVNGVDIKPVKRAKRCLHARILAGGARLKRRRAHHAECAPAPIGSGRLPQAGDGHRTSNTTSLCTRHRRSGANANSARALVLGMTPSGPWTPSSTADRGHLRSALGSPSLNCTAGGAA